MSCTRLSFLMKQAKITPADRKVTVAAMDRANKLGVPNCCNGASRRNNRYL